MFQARVTGEDDLRRVAARLKANGNPKAIRQEMLKGLRDATKPAVVAAKDAALRLPSKRPAKAGGLRRRTARATRAKVRLTGRDVGIRVAVARAPLGPAGRVPQLMNRGDFRHPVFGDRDKWVTQHGRPGWFDRANKTEASKVREGARAVLDNIERKLSGK